jgi:glycosyltransferase involved in cell wall biosynthesis
VRIGIVTDGLFPAAVGGIQRHTARLAPELVALGADVEVIAPHGHDPGSAPFAVATLPWPGGPMYPVALRRWAARCAAFAASRSYDVILGQGLNLWGLLPTGSPPELFHPHGLEMCTVRGPRARLKAWPLRFAARREAAQAAAVVSLGGRLHAIIRDSLGVAAERIVTIPNGVDPTEFSPGEETRDPATILWVGRFFPNKAPDRMIEVFRRLRTSRARLVLVGDGPMRPSLQAHAPEGVCFAGLAEEEELRELYRRATLVAVPSRDDGMPTVILEAFASGCAVVAFDVGAIAELVDDTTGALVAEGNLDGMASAIDALLADAARRAAAGVAARRRAEERFAWSAVAAMTLETLERVAS